MKVESEYVGELFTEPMKRTLDFVETKLSTGTTIRLLRCRDETLPKTEGKRDKDGNIPEGGLLKITGARNELVASYFDDNTKRYKDFVRMVVANTLPNVMPEFLERSKALLESLLPLYEGVDKVSRTDCQTVSGYNEFAEALQRR